MGMSMGTHSRALVYNVWINESSKCLLHNAPFPSFSAFRSTKPQWVVDVGADNPGAEVHERRPAGNGRQLHVWWHANALNLPVGIPKHLQGSGLCTCDTRSPLTRLRSFILFITRFFLLVFFNHPSPISPVPWLLSSSGSLHAVVRELTKARSCIYNLQLTALVPTISNVWLRNIIRRVIGDSVIESEKYLHTIIEDSVASSLLLRKRIQK